MQEELKQKSTRLVETKEVENKTAVQTASTDDVELVCSESKAVEPAPPADEPTPAYLGRRMLAWFTDAFIVTGLVSVATLVLMLCTTLACSENPLTVINTALHMAKTDVVIMLICTWCFATIFSLGTIPCFYMLFLLLTLSSDDWTTRLCLTSMLATLTLVQQLYFSGFLASRWQATPGKLLFNLKVTDKNGHRLSFMHCYFRELIKSMSTGLLGLPLLLPLCFGKRKLSHVLVSHSKVISTKSTEKQTLVTQFAPYIAAMSALIFGYVAFQLCAPGINKAIEKPRLYLTKQICGENSDAYCQALLEHISKLEFVHDVEKFKPPSVVKPTESEFAQLVKDIKLLETHWGQTDSRMMTTYLKALIELEYLDHPDLLEEYLKKYIACGEATNDNFYRAEGFMDYSRITRNAEGWLAYLYLTRPIYHPDLSETRRTQEAYDLAKKCLKTPDYYGEEFRVDLLRTFCKAANKLGKTTEARLGYEKLTELLCAYLNRLAIEHRNSSPMQFANSGMTGWDTCKDLLTLAELQALNDDLPGVRESLEAIARINWLSSPEDVSRLNKLKMKYPQLGGLIARILADPIR